MKKLLILITALFCFSGAAFAEDSYFGDFKTDTDMEIKDPGKNMLNKGPQFGGWFSPVMIYQGDSSDTYLSQSVNVLRVWFKSYLWNNASIYLRGKYSFTATLDENGMTAQDYEHVVDLDIGVINMAFFNNSLTVGLGRKYFLVGSGMVFNSRADGVEINYLSKYVNVQAMCNYTGLLLKDENQFSLRTAEYSSSTDNLFVGGTIGGSFFNQTFYAIALAQMQFEDDADGKRYDTQFYGGGVKGAIISGLTYYAEFVYQMGTYEKPFTPKYDIAEMGAAVEVKYSLDTITKPVFMLQYGYGSGSTDMGEKLSFVNYGTFFGGYGFNPQLMNIHVLRIGFSIAPTDMVDILWLKRMSFIAKYSIYLVDDEDAGFVGSPETSAGTEAVAGHGFDISLRWRIFSDLSFYANYGFFTPGAAIGSTDPDRHFFMGGLNISF